MKRTSKIQEYLKKVDLVKDIVISNFNETVKANFEERVVNLQKFIEDSQYIKIPLVGGFSAGKSSLLNTYLDRPTLLPVDVMPETAIAYELYYAPEEYVEHYRGDNKIATVPAYQIKTLNTQPGDIAKVYVKNETVKGLQERGIILVDMPGIGSGIEQHDAAITHYLANGSSFIFFVDAQAGTLKTSDKVFCEELNRYNQRPAFILTKSELVTEKILKDNSEVVKYYADDIFKNQDVYVSHVSAANKDISGFGTYINSLDAEAMLETRLATPMQDFVKSVIADLRTIIDINSKEIANIDELVADIEKEIASLKAELPEVANMKPADITETVLHNVHMALCSKVEDIASSLANGSDIQEVQATIISIIRVEIIASIKESSQEYADKLAVEISSKVEEIDVKLPEGTLDIMDSLKQVIDLVSLLVARILPPILKPFYKIITDLLGKLLGGIIKIFGFGGPATEKIKNELVKLFDKDIIDALRPKVLEIVTENQLAIREAATEEAMRAMENTKAVLMEKIQNQQQGKADFAMMVNNANDSIQKLSEIA